MERVCPFCGADLDEAGADAGSLPGTILCPTCCHEIDQAAPPPASFHTQPIPPVSPGDDAGPYLSGEMGSIPRPLPVQPSDGRASWEPNSDTPVWEAGGPQGILGSLWLTIWQVLLHPRRTLRAPGAPKHVWPLSFYLVLSSFGTTAYLSWRVALGGELPLSLVGTILAMIVMPALALLALYAGTCLTHLMLIIIRGNKGGFTATFRALAYSQAAVCIFFLIPWIGQLLVTVWGFVVMVAGLSGAHGISRWRVFWAVVLPLLLLGLLALGFMVLAGIWAFLTMGGQADWWGTRP